MSRTGFSPRRRARILAFLVLYGLSFAPAADREELREAFVSARDLDAGAGDATGTAPEERSANESGYAWELTEGVWSREKELNADIEKYSRNWRLDRMGRIELTLLRVALFEIYSDLAPPRTAIKEAVDMATLFGAGHAAGFLNGVLEAAAQKQAVK